MRFYLPIKLHVLHFLRQYGPLRILLMLCVGVLICFIPSIGTPMLYQGWAIVTIVLPVVLAPLVMAVLLFDAFMSRVLMSDAAQKERKRHQLIIITDSVLSAIVLSAWLPYFLSLG